MGEGVYFVSSVYYVSVIYTVSDSTTPGPLLLISPDFVGIYH